MTPDYDIEIDQGTDTERIFNCVDGYGNAMDFSGYTARMQIRRSTYKTAPLDELTSDNGRLVFEGARLTASDEASEAAAEEVVQNKYFQTE